MMEHSIPMNSSCHINARTTLELMGSIPSEAISSETKYEHNKFDSSTQEAPVYEDLLIQSEVRQPCLFLKSVVDDCHQSRLLSRVLEYYFVDNDPESFKECPCPMVNCQKPKFDDPRGMIRHLKNCEFFDDGLFRCPDCDAVKKFRTASKKSCSWTPKPSFRHRAQKKLKAAMDIIRKFASSQSDSAFYLGECRNCGHPVPADGLYENPRVFDSRCSSSPIYDPSSVKGHSEDENRYELSDSKLHALELHASPAHNRTQLSLASYDKYNHSGHINFDPSPLSSLPSELDSSSGSQGNIYSTDVSPTVTESLTTMSTNNSQGQSSSANHHQRSKSSSDTEKTLNNHHGMEQMQNNWKRPQSTCQSQSLFIQTNCLESNMNNMEWGNCTFYNDSTLEPMSSMEQLGIGNLSSSASVMQAPQLLDIGTYVDPSIPIVDGNITLNMVTPTTSCPLSSTIPSSSSTQPPESELSDDDLSCPHCVFRPSGKEQNLRAYLRKHVSTHGNPTYECEVCGRSFTRRDNMVVHRRKHYPDSTPSDFENQKRRRVSYSTIG
ncbi:uncharacterized protein F4807DRAFT_347609 [Annulohypoxylon truncatum]|uniref:uncharacterized protein n=1 Tax=Annulohypoxylon truncatum TaxID=327061 RepID=UPI002008224F|nr:uncharacterized protein F4807DRAFT_347609 [Annulohypoxylon truncatum]KAI1212717.1 hypothetical protein F4807DRAFT_347609 [Annulohypoxylon truncatum]